MLNIAIYTNDGTIAQAQWNFILRGARSIKVVSCNTETRIVVNNNSFVKSKRIFSTSVRCIVYTGRYTGLSDLNDSSVDFGELFKSDIQKL